MTSQPEPFELPPDFQPLVEALPKSVTRHHPAITIRSARTHNLKNVDAEIPHGKLTVVTGPSGSGKSSLAFDTLYAEGQRRYVESLSTYARQFLDRMQRPEVDSITGLQPAIAIEQKNTVRNARSTIGTATEISDFLRLLWARAGTVYCPECQIPVRADSPQSVLENLLEQRLQSRLLLVAPAPRSSQLPAEAFRQELLRAGFVRILGPLPQSSASNCPSFEVLHLDDDKGSPTLKSALEGSEGVVRIVVDRVVPDPDDRERLESAVMLAFQAGAGTVEAWDYDQALPPLTYRSGLRCNGCGTEYPWPEPNHFSFNSPIGACKTCSGFGRVTGPDWNLILPHRGLTLSQDCVAPFNTPAYRHNYVALRHHAKTQGIDLRTSLGALPADHLRSIQDFIRRNFYEELESERHKMQSRILIARYRGFSPCHDCGGTRLGPAGRRVFWKPDDDTMPLRSIDQTWALSVSQLLQEFQNFRPTPHEKALLERILEEILTRLEYLDRVGLGYLTLDRQTRTLSGGEAQRINLAAALGTALTRTLYVLDEPTVGLHPRDTRRLISILKDLSRLDNTIVVVEHDPEVILSADHLLDLGPQAGSGGGQVLYAGTPQNYIQSQDQTRTAQSLRSWSNLAQVGARKAKKTTKSAPAAPPAIQPVEGPAIRMRGIWLHSLQGLDVDIPLQKLVAITGVSGSGKSTLIHRALHANYCRSRGLAAEDPAPLTSLEGLEKFLEVLIVDQGPVARSVRSNPVTYVKAWDAIRTVLARTTEARALGLTDSSFSFNSGDGRCETCEGSGVVVYDMHFLAEMTLPCETCGGRRFNSRVLKWVWRGKTVDAILAMTVDDALDFFREFPTVLRRLTPLKEVGLGYITLGQSTATMSGGEAQRLKLAGFLAQNDHAGQSTLMIFDEPTTGLSLSDTQVLVSVFRRLVEEGYSLLVVEHNLEVIRQADWVLDMGPEAGKEGGKVVASGPPNHVAKIPESHTGRFLAEILG